MNIMAALHKGQWKLGDSQLATKEVMGLDRFNDLFDHPLIGIDISEA